MCTCVCLLMLQILCAALCPGGGSTSASDSFGLYSVLPYCVCTHVCVCVCVCVNRGNIILSGAEIFFSFLFLVLCSSRSFYCHRFPRLFTARPPTRGDVLSALFENFRTPITTLEIILMMIIAPLKTKGETSEGGRRRLLCDFRDF